MKLQLLLKSLGACKEAVAWVDDKELGEAWDTCERADWMLWLCGRMVDQPGWPDRKQLVLAACACAETSLKYVPKGEDRPRKAIETGRAWTRGEATIQQVRDAARATRAADAADAAYAAYAAADAADAAYAADAADAAARAAHAAAWDAYAAASYAAADAAARATRAAAWDAYATYAAYAAAYAAACAALAAAHASAWDAYAAASYAAAAYAAAAYGREKALKGMSVIVRSILKLEAE